MIIVGLETTQRQSWSLFSLSRLLLYGEKVTTPGTVPERVMTNGGKATFMLFIR